MSRRGASVTREHDSVFEDSAAKNEQSSAKEVSAASCMCDFELQVLRNWTYTAYRLLLLKLNLLCLEIEYILVGCLQQGGDSMGEWVSVVS